MSYITQANIEDAFGLDNVAVWSNLENDDTDADTARIAKAINYADAAIDDQFRDGFYSLPLTASGGGVPAIVLDWAAKLAGCWLYMSRGQNDSNDEGDNLQSIRDAVIEDMKLYTAGIKKMDAIKSRSQSSPTGPVVVT